MTPTPSAPAPVGRKSPGASGRMKTLIVAALALAACGPEGYEPQPEPTYEDMPILQEAPAASVEPDAGPDGDSAADPAADPDCTDPTLPEARCERERRAADQ